MTAKPGWARKRDRLRRHEADTASVGTAGPPWALSPAEWRLLAITFVGGLGSLLAAAVILGAALALARNEHGHLGNFALGSAIVIGLSLFSLTVVRRGWTSSSFLVERVIKPILLAAYCLMIAVLLLIWIGVAAGVK